MTLNSPDADAAISTYVQAEATVRQAKVTLTKTESDLERARKLLTFQDISAKDVLAAQNDQATARAALENAEAARAQSLRKLTLLGLSPTDLQQAVVVRAPMAGVVTDISVTPGDYRAAELPEVSRHRAWVAAIMDFSRRRPLGAVGAFIVLVMLLVAFTATGIAPYDPLAVDFGSMLAAPSADPDSACSGQPSFGSGR